MTYSLNYLCKRSIRLLNDLGIVLNFHDDPRLEDTHVLNPEWVTNGVYKLLNDAELIRDHHGILQLTMLNRILDRQRYPKNKYLFIIDMMRKFELCFNFDTDKKFLIPDLLPKNEPDTGNWDNTLAFEYHYDVLPGSIISRLIVRMNEWISQKTYWRSGVILANEGNRALVKCDREDKKIMIRVNGKEDTRRNLLTAIRSHFDCIHSTIPGIKALEKVPLLNYPDIPPVDYQWLVDLDKENIRTIIPTGLKKEIEIRKLLNGISSEQERQIKDLERKQDSYSERTRKPAPKPVIKEVFISYSWATESKEITDRLDVAFQAKGIEIIRDTKELGFKDRIKAFMERIGRGKCVIVMISKAYLESENCMFELLQISKNGQFSDRIFPIVLPDAKIFKSKDRIKYIQHWEQEIKELDAAMNSVGNANLQGFREDIDLYTEIRNIFSELINVIRDMNVLTTSIHLESEFSTMIEAVTAKLAE
ncbi:MAG: COR domain-containing protein [Cyanobacteria bacterium J06621_8]